MVKNNKQIVPKNTKGWVRIIEAFVAVLLITGVALIILDKGYIKKDDSSAQIYEVENGILRNIQNNDSLRGEILNVNSSITSLDNNFPWAINETVNNNKPAYLNCIAKICLIEDPCLDYTNPDKNVYSRSAIISANLSNYNPKQIKLFCLMRE
jgi:hypothetical protein